MFDMTTADSVLYFVIAAILVGLFIIRSGKPSKSTSGNPRIKRIFQICLAGNLVDRSVNDNWLEFKFANPNAVLVASKNLDLENFELSELHGKGLRVYTK